MGKSQLTQKCTLSESWRRDLRPIILTWALAAGEPRLFATGRSAKIR